jgi:cell division protein FtsQ
MARKTGSTISQEELYPAPDAAVREDVDDARLRDLDAEEESPFLRGQKRVPVRRSSIPKKTANRLTWAALGITVVILCGAAVGSLYRYGEHSWRFRIESSDDIAIRGTDSVPRSQVMEVMGGDIGRNIFFIPLAERKKQLEQIPWVESASVMRFVPNRLEVEIHERTPVAFARVGPKILLIDASGTLMELPAGKKKYSFPVILGTNPGEPLSTRGARMKIYSDLVSQLDSGGAHYSQDLSEVDLSDPEDVKVVTNDAQGGVLVHLGSENYLERYKIYVSHVRQWRQQFDKLESVDLRYERQIIVNPDAQGTARQAPLSFPAVKAAMAAGVKPAALVTHSSPVKTPAAAVAVRPAPKAGSTKSAGSKAAGNPGAAGLPPVHIRRSARQRTAKRARHHFAAKTVVRPAAAKSPAPAKKISDQPQKSAPSAKKKPSPAIARAPEP